MTTALERPGQNGQPALPGPAGGAPAPGTLSQPRGNWFRRNPAWPLIILLAGWPAWWALGIGNYAAVLAAIPMAKQMYMWRARRERPIKVPPAFGLWLLFLVTMTAGILTLHLNAPGTQPGPVSHRLASWFLRALSYFAATVVLLYAGNLTERELARRRLAWLLGLVAVYAVVGGLIGVLDPHISFTSPLAAVVPSSIQASDGTIASMLHPSVVDTATFQGFGRPSAPFAYANGWGDNFALLLPWLFVGWRRYGTRRSRRIAAVVIGLAIIPVVFSFDRGAWLGLLLSALYIFVRLTTAANLGRRLAVAGAVVLVFVIAIFATPLHSLIASRISHGSSDSGRVSQTAIAIKGALASPILGYGDTRHAQGSTQSISIGQSANCRNCGSLDIGSHGQLWLLLFSDGIPATIFYLGFFGYGVWTFRRDKSPYGLAGVLVLLLGFVFMFVYLTIGTPLTFTVLAYALLWRNDMARRAARARDTEQPAAADGHGQASLPAGAGA